jgi:citrate synthase
MKEFQRRTAISWVEPNHIAVRGFRIDQLMGRVSFGSAVYLVLTGELPDEKTQRLFEAILVSVIDHGPTPPSVVATTTVATTGAPLSSGVAAGILAISRYHGAAIEDCMGLLETCMHLRLSPTDAARHVVADRLARKKRIPGFGHRQHKSDPRVARLFDLAREIGVKGEYLALADALAETLSASLKRPIPLNADGAIAAVLCEMSFPRAAANGLFMVARIPGLVAHFLEEQDRNPPMLKIDPENVKYDGPKDRDLSE